jgi:branched-chain amino acid transport system permease protein
VFHRESGVFKTSYAADMALYPLPITKWAAAAFAGLFIVIAPLTLGEYYISILDLILIAVVGALGLNILVGYTGQISIGHGAFMSVGAYTAANLVVHLGDPFWVTIPWAGWDGGPDRCGGRHSVVAHQGALSRHRDARAQLIISDDQSRAGDLGRRPTSIQVPRPPFWDPAKSARQLISSMAFAVLATCHSNPVRSRIGRASSRARLWTSPPRSSSTPSATSCGLAISRFTPA